GKTAIDVVAASAASLLAIAWAVTSKKTLSLLWIISKISTELNHLYSSSASHFPSECSIIDPNVTTLVPRDGILIEIC
ncbi:hypothetical protein H0E87_019684, partial [Populus deltoides]